MLQHPDVKCIPLLFLLSTLCGCIEQNYSGEEEADHSPSTVTFTLTVARDESYGTRSDEGSTPNDAEIDPESVRAYLVNAAGNSTPVATVEDLWCYRVGQSEGGDIYQYYGVVDRTNIIVTDGAEYRCMILANTTEDLLSACIDGVLPAATVWTYDASILPTGTNTTYAIPMWGVQTFTWHNADEVKYVGQVSLLRAAVKSRVLLGEQMVKEGYSLGDVTLLSAASKGYLLPGDYTGAKTTAELNSTAGAEKGDIYCFNPCLPTEEDGVVQVPFYAEATNTMVAYFPERSLASPEDSKIKVELKKNNVVVSTPYYIYFKDYATDVPYTDLVRNRVYNFTITGFSVGVYDDLTVNAWEESGEEIDYTEHASGDWDVAWNEATYESLDKQAKLVMVKPSVPVELTFDMQTPVGATWFATLAQSNTSNDDYLPFVFRTEEGDDSSVSGRITSTTKVTLRVAATNANATVQHEAVLNVYIRYINGLTRKVEELSGWRFVQN
jgi:hypothetical protein